MLDVGDILPLPADPAELTRELALACCSHPEVLYDIFARLYLEQQSKPTPAAAPMLEGTANER